MAARENDNDLFNASSVTNVDLEDSSDDDVKPLRSSDKSGKMCRKRGRIAHDKIHSFFKFDSRMNTSICKHCNALIKLRNTTNLRRHLQAKHIDLFETYKMLSTKDCSTPLMAKKNQLPLASFFPNSSNAITEASPLFKPFIEALAIAFTTNGLPDELIEDPAFQAIFSFGPVTEFPSCRELAIEQENQIQQLREKIKAQLMHVKYLSITIDIWSPQSYMASFVGITAHFYCDDTGILKHLLIACKTIPWPHNTSLVDTLYRQILNDWNIAEEKVFRVIMDNGSNIVKAFRDSLHFIYTTKNKEVVDRSANQSIGRCSLINSNLDVSFDEEFDLENEQTPVEYQQEESEYDQYESTALLEIVQNKRLSCFAYELMLAVQNGLYISATFYDMQEKVKALISTITSSPKFVKALYKKSGLRLIKPYKTRWIYWFYVFDRLVCVKRDLNLVCEELKIVHEFSVADWQLLEELHDLLVVFAKAITELKGENYSTISNVYAMVNGMLIRLKKAQNTAITQEVRTIAEQLELAIWHRFEKVVWSLSSDFESIYMIATFLNPKLTVLIMPELMPVVLQELHSLQVLLTSMDDVPMAAFNDQQSSDDEDDVNDDDDCIGLAIAAYKINSKPNGNSSKQLLRTVSSMDAQNSQQEVELKKELQMFQVDREHYHVDKDFDVLVYWKTKKYIWPNLYTIATTVLAVPATSTPCKCGFSCASSLLEKRHKLSEGLENEILFKINAEFVKN